MESISVIKITKKLLDLRTASPIDVYDTFMDSPFSHLAKEFMKLAEEYQMILLPKNLSEDVILRILLANDHNNEWSIKSAKNGINIRVKRPINAEKQTIGLEQNVSVDYVILPAKFTLLPKAKLTRRTQANCGTWLNLPFVSSAVNIADVQQLYQITETAISVIKGTRPYLISIESSNINTMFNKTEFEIKQASDCELLIDILKDIKYSTTVYVNRLQYLAVLYKLSIPLSYLYKITDEDQYDQTIEQYKLVQSIKQEQIKQFQMMLHNETYKQQVMIMISQKFGENRLNEILKKYKYQTITKDVLIKNLSKKEWEVIMLNMKLLEESTKILLSNKCFHLKLVREVRTDLSKFQQLKPLYDNSDKSGWIKCNNCNQNLMCQHMWNMYQMMVEHRQYKDIINELLKFAITDKPNANFVTTYYCKICGGKLVETDEYQPSGTVSIDYDIEMRREIWSLAIRSIKVLKTSQLYDPKTMASIITNDVYPIVTTLISKYKKSNELKLQQLIIVGVYAMIYNIIKTSNGNITIGKQKDVLSFIFGQINHTNSSVMSQMTTDEVKAMFEDIYTRLSPLQIMEIDIDQEVYNDITMCDPIYNYAKNIMLANGKKESFDAIIGHNVKQLLEKSSPLIYEDIWTPTSNIKINNIYKIFVDYLITNNYDEEQYNKYKNEEIENGQFLACIGKGRLYPIPPKHQSEVSIVNLYDENGERHEWNLYIYEKSANKGLTKKEAIARENLGKFVDYQCSVCKILYKDVGTLSIEKVQNGCNKKQAYDVFFAYYQSRCPKGGLHDKQMCSKCGYAKTDEYYKKYLDVFEEDIKVTESITTIDNNDKNKTETKYEPLDIDMINEVVRIAKLCNVKMNEFYMLGLSEGFEYEHVQNGTIEYEPIVDLDPRIFLVNSYIIYILGQYETLKVLYRKIHIPPYLKPYVGLKTEHYPSITYEEIIGPIKAVADNLHKAYVIGLCNLLGRILDITKSEEYVVMIAENVLHMSQMMTKAEKFNWASLRDVDEVDTTDTIGEDVAQKEMDEIDKDEEDGGGADLDSDDTDNEEDHD